MKVALRHVTRLEYDGDVVESVMDARLGPHSDEQQRWQRFDLRLKPAGAVRRYVDGFGNVAHLLSVAKPHATLEVITEGEVLTLLADPFRPARPAPMPITPQEQADYLGPSPLVPLVAALAAMAEPHRPPEPGDAFAAAQRLMDLVHADFAYRSDVTTVRTTVADVLEARGGVCQDLAHVLIGLCRSAGIPTRYVSGYVVAGDASAGHGTVPPRGAGHSHAWAEAYTPTHGWRGFDPTNGLLASEHHVKMAIGRDYRDVSPTRGTFRGAATERLSVQVAARALA